ncbi:MAG: hypothetical protein GY796_29880 [Chloroflexi bacterium]|nr:hypothetical protein [Chloroflexota bacterium]
MNGNWKPLLLTIILIFALLIIPWMALAAPLMPDADLSQADTIFEAEAAGDQAGDTVAGLGDINGDGLPDFAIGAPHNDEAGNNAGQVYIFWGRPEGWGTVLDLSLADASFLGERSDARAGNVVAAAGDVNNDGFNDILIGAYSDGEAGTRAGQIYLVLGKATGWAMDISLSLADASFLGENLGDEAGTAVAGVGDANGDGFDDILIGAPKNDYAGNRAGQAYLILGQATGWAMDMSLSLADASFLGEKQMERATSSLAGAGDVNGDGFDDLVIGDWGLNNHVPNGGEAYLIFGKATGWTMHTSLLDSDASFMGEALGNWAGYSVDGVGDVNGDSFDDVLIGAPGSDDHGRQTGEAYLILGKATGWTMKVILDQADASFRSEWWGLSWAGSTVAGAGDINNDGLNDLLITAGIDEEAGIDSGQTFLVLGRTNGWSQDMDLMEAVSFLGEDGGDNAGDAMTSLGDVNNDGLNDILIGAPLSDAGGPDAGRAYLLLGNNGPSSGGFSADRPFAGVDAYHTFSTSFYDLVDGFGDLRTVQLQAKGGSERLIARYRPALGLLWLRDGATWLGPCQQGQPGVLTGASFELDCEGTAVSNDGQSKLQVDWRMRIIGSVPSAYTLVFDLRAWDMDRNDSGKQRSGFWVVDPNTHDLDLSQADDTFLGEIAMDLGGWAVADAGDVNNDGFGDILIGAPKNEETSLNGGQTYLFLGDAIGWGTGLSLADADASFSSESQYDYAGLAVSSTGDVNGDGFDDFMIGAYSNEDAGITGGKAYLILGKASGWAMDTSLTNADASFLNEGADYVGWSAAGAGDVNNDGYDDFLIGAWGAKGDVGQSAGVAFLILGKTTGWATNTSLATADASFVGEAARHWASYSLSGAGDVNNDGYDDFLIGAPKSNENGLQVGQVYLILGQATGWTFNTSLSLADASFLSANAGDLIGMAVSGAGDVNNDGFDDILIDAWGNNAETGQVYLFLGGAGGWAMDTLLPQADASFVGENEYDRAGHALSALGDLNGDGFDDFAIGSPGNDDGGSNAGKVYVILGQGSGWTMGASLADAYAAYWGEAPHDRAGNAIAGVLDATGSGSVSLLVGAPGNDEGAPGDYNAGKVYHVMLQGPGN